MIVVDTTVLVYAVGAVHPLKEPCRRLIELVGEDSVDATTTVEVIQEFVHVRARRRSRSDAAALGNDFATMLSPLLRPDGEQLADGLELFLEIDELGAFDSVLAATARGSGAAALVSADRAFAAVPQLRYLDPSRPDFESELRRT